MMFIYIARRVLAMVPVLLLVVTVVFFAFQIIPGDPARLYVGPDASLEAVEAIRKELGLDQPVWTQYTAYMRRLLTGDLGKSISLRRPVVQELERTFPATFRLALVSIVVSTVVGMALGTVAAVNRGRLWDRVSGLSAVFGLSMPTFWLGLLLIYLFSVNLRLLPSTGEQDWRSYIMPTICLSAFSIAFIARMTRSSLLEVIRLDYVRTARAKGAPEWAVITRHALRNALLPVVTVVGLRFGYMLGGAVVTEEIFAWPGMGRLLVVAVGQRDIPLVQGLLLLFAGCFVLVNLLVDVSYAFLDPRIRYR
jgi:ABC-type dipeptide/oligopeptide/nickel transport system permease component